MIHNEPIELVGTDAIQRCCRLFRIRILGYSEPCDMGRSIPLGHCYIEGRRSRQQLEPVSPLTYQGVDIVRQLAADEEYIMPTQHQLIREGKAAHQVTGTDSAERIGSEGDVHKR